MGISLAPSIRQLSNSHGSRTSTSRTPSPRSSLRLVSAGVISRSFIKIPRLNYKLESNGWLESQRAGNTAPWERHSPEWRFGKENLLPSEFWHTLLEKSANAFPAILRIKTFHLLLDFQIQELGKFVFVAAEQNSLDCANRNNRPVRDLMRQRVRFRFKLRQRHHAIHNPDPQRLRRVNHLAGVKQFRRLRRTHQLRQKKCPA